MVFNWFRRQFNERQETETEETQAEQQLEVTTPSEESEPPQEQPSEVAADYLLWAKAAYKNIQQQQQEQKESSITTTETESPNSTLVADSLLLASVDVPQTVAESVSEQVEDSGVEVAIESIETEISQTTQIDVKAQAENFVNVTESADNPDGEVVKIEPIAAQTQDLTEVVERATEVDITDNPAAPESAITSSPAPLGDRSDEDITLAASEQELNVPFWARESSAERQARLERLKATAIETEPEPVAATTVPTQADVTQETLPQVTGLDFDEGFLWSAEVLASQGRSPEQVSLEEISWLKRLRQGLEKTRRSLINQLKAIVGQGPLNQDAVMEIESLLLQADCGVEATDRIINKLQQRLREEVLPPEEAIAYLKQILRELLDQPFQESYSPTFAPEKGTLNIWLMTGVNGAGKTTTVGKIAHLAQKSGFRCLIGAADTFRAAAVEQVKIWGQRSGTEVIANTGKNTDPAAVVFDAIAAAQSRGTEMLLIDTAGRLQNKKNLMDELSKIRRIVDKKAPNAKVESLLVLDATLGQNGLRQAQVFSEAAKLSGVVLTKLDGTAKGGVAIAVVQQLGLPIRFIGAGEGIEDLRPFSSYEFVEALLSG